MTDGSSDLEVTNLGAVLAQLRSAVERVEEAVAAQHDEQIRRFLETDGTPKVRTIKVPDPLSNGWTDLEVPLLALVPPAQLQLREVSVEFAATLTDIGDAGSDPAEPVDVNTVWFEKPLTAHSPPSTIRVNFDVAGQTRRLEESISIRDGLPRANHPNQPPRRPRSDPMSTDPSDEYRFEIEGLHLRGEERIDPHEEHAAVDALVRMSPQSDDPVWEPSEVRLIIDTESLPDTIVLDGSDNVEGPLSVALDLDDLLERGETTVSLVVRTGVFADGPTSAESGGYELAAGIEAWFVPVGGGLSSRSEGSVTIEVAPD